MGVDNIDLVFGFLTFVLDIVLIIIVGLLIGEFVHYINCKRTGRKFDFKYVLQEFDILNKDDK